jgi:hypothetical protein
MSAACPPGDVVDLTCHVFVYVTSPLACDKLVSGLVPLGKRHTRPQSDEGESGGEGVQQVAALHLRQPGLHVTPALALAPRSNLVKFG